VLVRASSGLRRGPVALPVLALLLSLPACTGDESPAGSTAGQEVRSAGPVTLNEDTEASSCLSLGFGRDFAVYREVVTPTEEITVTDVALVDAGGGVEARDVAAAPLTSDVPATGVSVGWPWTERTAHIDWDARVTGEELTLSPDRAWVVFVHVHVDEAVASAEYEAIEVTYTAGGSTYSFLDATEQEFTDDCLT
jgi:hypothetical protein